MKQNKHILAVFDVIPHPEHGGGGVTAFSIVKSLVSTYEKVSLVVLDNQSDKDVKAENDLKQLGVANIEHVSRGLHHKKKLLHKIFPRDKDIIPILLMRNKLNEVTEKIKPDVIIAYHWEAVAALYGNSTAPKLALVGDPIHLPQQFRVQFQKRYGKQNIFSTDYLKYVIRSALFYGIKKRSMLKLMTKLLCNFNSSGAFAAHHAELLHDLGAKNCKYYRTPVPDPGKLCAESTLNNKFKILHIGHLQGIATLTGIELLTDEIMPILNKELGEDNFEVHIVGGLFETLPKKLKSKLTKPNIKIRGQISPPDNEFLSSHVVLVPTPIELGIRVRIITAMSYGSCIVAHNANKKGIPELSSYKNAILCDSGKELAEACIKIYRNKELVEKLGEKARKEYDTVFSINTAGKDICNELEKIGA